MNMATEKSKPGKKREASRTAGEVTKTIPEQSPWLPPAIVAMITFVAFLPVLGNGFINYDDIDNLLENQNYRGMGWTELRWMFTTFHLSLYRPLTWLTLALDYFLWGMNPVGYHLTSLLFHTANAVLFYFVSLRLLRLALPEAALSAELPLRVAAGFSALFFSLHPLRVEAVAWASARNDVVSALFLLSTILCYLHAVKDVETNSRYWRWMMVTWVVYCLSLLAKPIGMTLPVILLVLDIYPLKRLGGRAGQWFQSETRRIWWEKVPFLVLSLAAGVLALLAKQASQAMHGFEKFNLAYRSAQAFYGLVFYLRKTVMPFGLSPLYQLPVNPDPWDWPFVLSGCFVLITSVVLFVARHRWPAELASWVCYAALLSPVLGFAQFGPQMAADRYSYLSCLAWAVLAGGGAFYAWELRMSGGISGRTFVLAKWLALALLMALGALTWRQVQFWHDSERLWKHALAIDPRSSFAYNNLAAAMDKEGRRREAIEYYRKAVEFDPEFVHGHFNLANTLARADNLDDLDEAIQHYRIALKIDPSAPAQVHHNLANVLARRGDLEGAIQDYRTALKMDPSYAAAHNNLGNVLAKRGELDEAIQEYRKAAELSPKESEPYFNLGNIMVRERRLEEAVEYFQQAIKANPDYAEAHHNLGRVLAAQGKLDEAIDHFKQAMRIQPEFAEAYESLAVALAEQGRGNEAIRYHYEAMRILNLNPETRKKP